MIRKSLLIGCIILSNILLNCAPSKSTNRDGTSSVVEEIKIASPGITSMICKDFTEYQNLTISERWYKYGKKSICRDSSKSDLILRMDYWNPRKKLILGYFEVKLEGDEAQIDYRVWKLVTHYSKVITSYRSKISINKFDKLLKLIDDLDEIDKDSTSALKFGCLDHVGLQLMEMYTPTSYDIFGTACRPNKKVDRVAEELLFIFENHFQEIGIDVTELY